MDQEQRRIEFEKLPFDKERMTRGGVGRTGLRVGGEGSGDAKKKGSDGKKKVDSNPGVVAGVLVATVAVTLVTWGARAYSGAVSRVTSPRVVEFEIKGGKRLSKKQPKIEWVGMGKSIDKVVVELRGTYAVYVYDFETGEEWGRSEKKEMQAASLMKLPVLIALYKEAERGRIDLDSKYSLVAADKVGGSGSMFYKSAGTVFTYRKMAELMGQQSDNTAYNVAVKLLGRKKIEETINEMGLSGTDFALSSMSAYDAGTLLRKLYRGQILNRENGDEILRFLSGTIYEDRIPAGVPTGVRVAHKVGTEAGVVSDAGIIYGDRPYVLVVMSEGAGLEEARKALPSISTIVWGFFKR